VVAVAVARGGGFSLDRFRGKIFLEQKAWLNFCYMGIIPMILSPIALMLVRSALGNELGWNAAGIWQSVWRVSDFFSVGFSSVLGVLILPCVSAELSKTEFWKIFKPILLRVFLLAAVIVGLVFLFRHFVILLLFSSEFSAAAELLPTQLIGDFFRAGGWCVGLVLVARQATKIFVIAEVSSQVFFVLFSIFGISYFGIQAPLMAYASENICYFFILLFILRKLSWKTP
jgi:PST family polysaccharide transporter